jgi:hypothetical protein
MSVKATGGTLLRTGGHRNLHPGEGALLYNLGPMLACWLAIQCFCLPYTIVVAIDVQDCDMRSSEGPVGDREREEMC